MYGVELSAHTEWGPVTMDLAYAHGRSSRLFDTLNAGHPFRSPSTFATTPARSSGTFPTPGQCLA